ncbi:hypothetical protein NA57DRAFT_56158 [Rhizodiscina lignyota]|uniref:TMEM205-like domain-containing protein n=1 Tax=Rhizodiscina lignyota TaxID=1504668 RepID=A0A9P4IHC9_9PEZI|nr:hypothetical protein NA57DRAFT_56158 [Rhizodiscina lignyota]
MGSQLSSFAASSLYRLLPSLHLLSYATLLGTGIYQTFFMTKICFQALPMSAFTTLQKRVFPVYFQMQLVLATATLVTYLPSGPVSLKNSPTDFSILALNVALSALNFFKYGPRTSAVMVERIHQGVWHSRIGSKTKDDPNVSRAQLLTATCKLETRDGKKYNAKDTSEEMRKINRRFSREHAMSIHLNLIAVLASLGYGFRLAPHIQIK